MHILNNEIVQALCWMLIHSLWQGLLLAISAGLVIMITKKSSSALRYNILAGLFFAFILISCFTFFNQLKFAEKNNSIENPALIDNPRQINNAIQSPVNIIAEKNHTYIFINYFNEHASLVVAIWFIILSAQFVKMLASIGYIQRIRYYKTNATSPFWQNKIKKLATRLQIKKHIALIESEIVKVPVLIGFLKPVILFPFSLMSQLSPEQIEAVLLHELAHVKRKDYFVNLLQSFAEIIFFFNPGVLWISSLIRDERENCCDDIAINQTKNKKEFIHALVIFQEYNMARSKYAIAFPGQKNHLLNRVKRILTNNNKTLNNMEKITLASGIIIISLATFAFAQTTNPVTEKIPAIIKQVSNALENISATEEIKDTVPEVEQNDGTTTKIVSTIDGKEYKLVEADNKIIEFYFDGKKIPDEKIEDYRSIIDQIHKEMKENTEKMELQQAELQKQQELLETQQEEISKQAELQSLQDHNTSSQNSINRLDKQQKVLDDIQLQLDKKQIELQDLQSKLTDKDYQKQLKLQAVQLLIAAQQLKEEQENIEEQRSKMSDKNFEKQNNFLQKKLFELQSQEFQLQNLNSVLCAEIAQNPLINPAPEVNVLTEMQPPAPPVPLIKQNETILSVINDLKNESIITDDDNLSFTLNNKTFKVNGVVQPQSVQAEFKEKYIKHVKDHVIYSTSHGSTHADVYVDDNK